MCMNYFHYVLGKLDGTVNGVSYFKCKAEHGIFTTRDKIITNPLKL